jgi:UDP-sulfoquinovose synthase
MVRILVLGGDGYLGWPTALHFSSRGHDVAVLDSLVRRSYDDELGTASLVPIADLSRRVDRWQAESGRQITAFIADLTRIEDIERAFEEFGPEVVVHYGEQRSAPYSMIDRSHAVYTQVNNVVGTLNLLYAIAARDPDIHLVKLGTMGEYGTPNIDIEEGFIDITHKGRVDRLPFPKQPGSFYHLSKVHDSHNMTFACNTWGLRATDLHQGVVYGQATEETALHPELATRLDYDAVFGTVLNRFVVEAVIGHPLSIYGTGGQTRGFLNIRDTLACVELAVLHPARRGEYRVFNQFTESFSINELAKIIGASVPQQVTIEHVDDPRVEAQEHYYHAANTKLLDLGLVPHTLDEAAIRDIAEVVERHRDRILPETLHPDVDWRNVAPSSTRLAPSTLPVGID